MKKNFNHYNGELREFAHELRNESVSRAEKFLWKSLLSRGRAGTKFKRQRPIDRFIVDFFAGEIGLIIEVDGSSHYGKPEYDYYRQKRLEYLGYRMIRFHESIVLGCLNDVAEEIIYVVEAMKFQQGK